MESPLSHRTRGPGTGAIDTRRERAYLCTALPEPSAGGNDEQGPE